MKIDWLLAILNILANTDRITVKELTERFEVSKRTIFRDLVTINESGIPIVTYSGIGGGVSIIEGYKYKRSVFSREDLTQIFTALSGLMSIEKDKHLVNLMAKIMPEETTTFFSKSNYVIDLSSWFTDSISRKKIIDIRSAIEKHQVIKMEYISKSGRGTRTILYHNVLRTLI